MGARTTQTVVEPLVIPGNHARVTQTVAEALSIPLRSGVNARLTQTVVEPLFIPVYSRQARLTQTLVEFLYLPGTYGATSCTEDFYFIKRPQVSRY
jgi:hypothetical protein